MQDLHKITQDFLDSMTEQEEKLGVVLEDYKRIYKYGLFFAKWNSLYHEHKQKDKPLRATIYHVLRSQGETQKDAEMGALNNPKYQEHIVKLIEARTVSLEAKALLNGLVAKMEHIKSLNIKNAIEMKTSGVEGYGAN